MIVSKAEMHVENKEVSSRCSVLLRQEPPQPVLPNISSVRPGRLLISKPATWHGVAKMALDRSRLMPRQPDKTREEAMAVGEWPV